MIKAILFDLDGTLLDSPKIIMEGYKEAIRKHVSGYNLTESETTAVLGMTLSIAFDRHKENDEHLNEMIDTFREVTNRLTKQGLMFYDNAEEVINYLKAKGYLVGIVTSKNRKIVLENLESVGFDVNIFDCLVTSNDTVLHKPNPDPIIYALEQLNVNSDEAIYIGDHENDIKAGFRAKLKTGLMGYSYRLNEAIKEEPTYIFKDLLDIKNIF